MPPHVNTLDALSVLCELFTWIGLLGGVVLLPIGVAARLAGRRWVYLLAPWGLPLELVADPRPAVPT